MSGISGFFSHEVESDTILFRGLKSLKQLGGHHLSIKERHPNGLYVFENHRARYFAELVEGSEGRKYNIVMGVYLPGGVYK
jgi:hypothetical protein